MLHVNNDASVPDPFDLLQGCSLKPFAGQVAGHRWAEGKVGFLRGNGCVYKPLQNGDRGQRELKFYRMVGAHELLKTLPWFPHLHGVLRADGIPSTHESYASPYRDGQGQGQGYLVLDDVTSAFTRPCVMDLKIGLRTWSPLATDAKRKRAKAKYPPQAVLGFRSCGMRVWDSDTEAYTRRGRKWGLAITEDTVHRLFDEFFLSTSRGQQALSPLLMELDKLLKWHQTQRYFRAYASSILLIYEGDTRSSFRCAVRMIDFAHTFPGSREPDDNYVCGLTNLVHHIRRTQDKSDAQDYGAEDDSEEYEWV